MRRSHIAVAVALAAGLVLTACQLLVGITDETGVSPDGGASSDAQVDAGVADGTSPPALCVGAVPPDGAFSTDAKAPRVLTFALSALHIRPTGVPPLGYNLDQRCTVGSQQLPCASDPTTPNVDDDPGGVDNRFGIAVDQAVSQVTGDGGDDPAAKTINRAIGNGLNTMVLSLQGYDGYAATDGGVTFADDHQILFGMTPSPGLAGNACDAGGGGEGGVPTRDGCDIWSYVDGGATYSSGGDPPVVNVVPGATAFVRDGLLVVNAPALSLAFGTVRLTVKSAVLTAKLGVDSNGVPTMTGGVIAGRMLASDLIRSLLGFTISDLTVCQQSGLRDELVPAFCPQRDLRLSPQDDGQQVSGKLAACDAISIAVGFDAVAAQVGSVGPPLPEESCPDFDASCPALP